jgi:phage baseplate assembly protein W
MGLSTKLPLEFSERYGHFEQNEDVFEQIKQNLKDLLLTAPGERFIELEYGVGLYDYLFEPMTARTLSRVEDTINAQIATYMPFVLVRNLSVLEGTDNIGGGAALSVVIDYVVIPLGDDAVDYLEIELKS